MDTSGRGDLLGFPGGINGSLKSLLDIPYLWCSDVLNDNIEQSARGGIVVPG